MSAKREKEGRSRGFRAPEPRKVWSNHEAILREGADYLSERFRGTWETVDQEQCWFVLIASQTNLQFGTFNQILHHGALLWDRLMISLNIIPAENK
jgi:hypothetical protein